MRSTEAPPARGAQSGQSLVESLVASALLGIAAVAGITAWDTAGMGARKATRLAWAHCVARGELEAVLASRWDTSYPTPDANLVRLRVRPIGEDGSLQEVSVKILDPDSRSPIYRASVLKASVLAGQTTMTGETLRTLQKGCPPP